MSKLVHYTWQQVENACHDIVRSIYLDGWKPDYVVGITRGGSIPATMISHYLDVPMRPLQINLRDNIDCVSDTGMAEDAFGYSPSQFDGTNTRTCWSDTSKKNILVVDDINDSGATLNWLKQDWPASCFPNSDRWQDVWHNNVRFAVIVNNLASSATVDYSYSKIDKSIEDFWVVFPWESFWIKAG